MSENVGVVSTYARRRHHSAGDDVVRHIEQPTNELSIAGNPFGRQRVPRDRRAPHEEAALGTGRNDHRIFDGLRLNETEHFGAVILGAVRPPQTAARDRPRA